MSTITRAIDYNSLRVVAANNYLCMRGGSERVMLDEADTLRNLGHQVALFGRSPGHANGMPHSDLFPRLVDFAKTRGLARPRAALNVIYNCDTGRRFAEFLRRTRPDIVHCHNIYGGLTTSVVDACQGARVPCVLTLHDYKLACPSYLQLRRGRPCERCLGGQFYHCLLSRCHKNSVAASLVVTAETYFNKWLAKYRKVALFITPSRFLLERIVQSGTPREKLRCVPNGIDSRNFRPVYSDLGYALYVGRLSHEKGIRTLIDAIDGTSMAVRVVGDGPQRDSLQGWVRERGLGNVVFEGQKTGPELESLFQGAAFVVVPSLCYENASMVVLEAMAYGKPVIGSRIGGIPEQIEEDRTGLLFEPGDHEDLRRAINALLCDPGRRYAMGGAARQRVEECFSLEHHCAQITRIYYEAIRG